MPPINVRKGPLSINPRAENRREDESTAPLRAPRSFHGATAAILKQIWIFSSPILSALFLLSLPLQAHLGLVSQDRLSFLT